MFILLKKIYIDSVHSFSMLNIHVTPSLDKRSLSMSLAGISQRRPLSCQWHAYSPTTLPPFTKLTSSVGQIKIKEKQKIWEND